MAKRNTGRQINIRNALIEKGVFDGCIMYMTTPALFWSRVTYELPIYLIKRDAFGIQTTVEPKNSWHVVVMSN